MNVEESGELFLWFNIVGLDFREIGRWSGDFILGLCLFGLKIGVSVGRLWWFGVILFLFMLFVTVDVGFSIIVTLSDL